MRAVYPILTIGAQCWRARNSQDCPAMLKTFLMITSTAVLCCWLAGVRPGDVRHRIMDRNDSASARFNGSDGKNDWGR